jgi:hypothetical protein
VTSNSTSTVAQMIEDIWLGLGLGLGLIFCSRICIKIVRLSIDATAGASTLGVGHYSSPASFTE